MTNDTNDTAKQYFLKSLDAGGSRPAPKSFPEPFKSWALEWVDSHPEPPEPIKGPFVFSNGCIRGGGDEKKGDILADFSIMYSRMTDRFKEGPSHIREQLQCVVDQLNMMHCGDDGVVLVHNTSNPDCRIANSDFCPSFSCYICEILCDTWEKHPSIEAFEKTVTLATKSHGVDGSEVRILRRAWLEAQNGRD